MQRSKISSNPATPQLPTQKKKLHADKAKNKGLGTSDTRSCESLGREEKAQKQHGQASDAKTTYFACSQNQNVAQSHQNSPTSQDQPIKLIWTQGGPKNHLTFGHAKIDGFVSPALSNVASNSSLLAGPVQPNYAGFSTTQSQGDKQASKGSFVKVSAPAQKSNVPQALEKKPKIPGSLKPTKLCESQIRHLNMHSEYANTPTAKTNTKPKGPAEQSRLILSPQALKPAVSSSKNKNEKAFSSFKVKSDVKERLDSFYEESKDQALEQSSKMTPVRPLENFERVISKPSIDPDQAMRKFRHKQQSRIMLDPKSLDDEQTVALSSEKPSSNTVDSYKSVELQIEIVQDEALVNPMANGDVIFSDTNHIILGANLKKPSKTSIKEVSESIEKQSVILVKKKHLEIKSEQRQQDRSSLIKSVVVSEQKKSIIEENGWLAKNSEAIKKQMKNVISLQSIIAPTSHNQSNAELDRAFKSNKFSKTFHQNQAVVKQTTLLAGAETARQNNDVFDIKFTKPHLQGAVTLRQDIHLGKGQSSKKGSQSGQLQIFKRSITLAKDQDLSVLRRSEGTSYNAPTALSANLELGLTAPKDPIKEIKTSVIELTANAVTPKVAQVKLLKKTEIFQKKLIQQNRAEQPNKSQKSLKTKQEESNSRKPSVTKPESRLQSSGVSVAVAKRAGSLNRRDEPTKLQMKLIQGKSKHALKQNVKIASQINQIGQVRSELKKGIQNASYSTTNVHVGSAKVVEPIPLVTQRHHESLVEVIKLSGGKTNRGHSPLSMPDSIPETHKNGVQPQMKFKFNGQAKGGERVEATDSSDESVASCLIPSENERFEVIKKPNNLQSWRHEGDGSVRLGSNSGSKTNVISLSALKGPNYQDKILPGHGSQSLLEQQRSTQPLVNEVRVSENRANKALSFVGNGLFSDQQLRAFNLMSLERQGILTLRKNNDEGSSEVQVQGPGSLIATSNQMRQKALEVTKAETRPAQPHKYQPPHFLSKEIKLIKSPKKKPTEQVKSPGGGDTTKRIPYKSSILNQEKHIYSQSVITTGGFSAAADAITVKQAKLTSASHVRVPQINSMQEKRQITTASKGKESGNIAKIEVFSDKILSGQKSSSCLVPSKESALKSKQLLTGVVASDKYNETESGSRHTQNDVRGIRSFVIDENRTKNSLIQPNRKEPEFQPLPSAASFTQKIRDHSARSKDSNSTDSNRKQSKKLTPSKALKPKAQPIQPNRLKVVQEERIETQDSGNDKSPGQYQATNESALSPRTRIIARIQRQIRSKFAKTGCPPETQVEWYKIGKVMGKGAFGKVNLAIHRLSSKFVALKSINKSVMNEEASKRKVMQEFNILRHTRHCNIVRLYESFETAQHIVFVMEVCGGGDLLTYVRKRRKLKEDVAKFLFQQIITGLKYINQKNVLHRDIKLDNILLTSQGDVKICDFGVSKLVEKNELLKEQCGTPAYIAPEVFENKGYEGYASDIWSAGVVLYAMLYGAVPFKASNMSELHKQVVKCKPSYKDEISEQAKNLLQGILEKDPKKRLTAAQILEHPWMVDAGKKKVSVFTDTEKRHIIEEFEYYNVRKEKDFDPESAHPLPTDPFAEQMLSSTQNIDLKNVSSRSIILAPFNSTRSQLEVTEDDLIVQRLMQPKNVIKFSAKVKEIERQYEMNNNAELDNGVYHQEDNEEQAKPEPTMEDNLASSFNAEQLQSQLSELRLETEHQDLAHADSFQGQDDADLEGGDELRPMADNSSSEWQKLKNMMIKGSSANRKLEIKQSESYEEVQIELYLDESNQSPTKPAQPQKSKKSLLKSASMASSGPKAENSGTLIVEEHLLQQIERSNFPKAYIVASLNNDELNHVTTFYYLLKTPKEY